ncbi:MAG: transcription elongation factor GreA [Bacteroidales bacterium]|nr:transcription elongation factor GreA [Bacteroidales bacterium]
MKRPGGITDAEIRSITSVPAWASGDRRSALEPVRNTLCCTLSTSKRAMEYLSKQRYDEISAELKNLIEVVYPKVQEDLQETGSQGDRSDNAGYREARRIQAKTISRIRFLQKILEHSRVIDPNVLPKDRVSLLSNVEFTNLATGTRMKFEIVSSHEMNLEAGKISLKSPIGAALMGKKVGEIAEAQVPSGVLHLRIESITFD